MNYEQFESFDYVANARAYVAQGRGDSPEKAAEHVFRYALAYRSYFGSELACETYTRAIVRKVYGRKPQYINRSFPRAWLTKRILRGVLRQQGAVL